LLHGLLDPALAVVRKNQCVDAASAAAWLAATISAMSAVIAGRQARHARDSAEGALRQAEGAQRQAATAEEDLLLRKLEIQAGGDRTRALRMSTGRALAMNYLTTAKNFLDLLSRATRWGFPSNSAQSRLEFLWTLLAAHLAQYRQAAEEQRVSQVVDWVSDGIAEMNLDGWLVSPFSIEGIDAKRLYDSARIQLVDLNAFLSDPLRFDRANLGPRPKS
jgi:hypothetical protein